MPTVAEIGPYLLIVLTIFGALITWKSGLLQQLTSGQKDLLAQKNDELATLKGKIAELSVRIKELEEYNRLLILNSRTAMEIVAEIKESKSGRKRMQHDE